MKIAVAGAGALGSLFAGFLAKSGVDVILLDIHSDRAAHVSRNGLVIETDSGEETVPIRAAIDFAEADGAEFFLVCVKSWSTAAAAAMLAPFVGPNSAVLTLQNGIGNVEKICGAILPERVIAGTTSNGANVRGVGRIRFAGRGETIVGELDGSTSDRVARIVETFIKAGLPARASTNVSGLLWGKLLINAGINPITAILRIENGGVLERPPAHALMNLAVLEGYKVCAAKGITLEYPDPLKKVEEVARLTAKNISSMHQDVRAGRRTEIDAICGAIVREAKALGIETPINEMFWNILMAREELQT